MTREEVIKNIKEHCYFANLIPQAKEALDIAIKALEQEPCDKCVYSTSEGCQYDDITEAMPPVSSSEKPNKSECEHDHEILKAYSDGASAVLESLIEQYEHYLELLDADMKDGSATIVTKTKYAVYTEVVEQLKEVSESEGEE